MSIEISQEIEVRLTGEAQRQGISVDALLERFISESPAVASPMKANPELPIWRLGRVGGLHRRDIYDDAR